ncbi:MAG: endonuclease/exonuclease/phosphatase family protein [Gemmatimonadaceae bacterium]|nr:endonuclease/exonuclease/phosphatase family protein [Gemmatimonadaceae bacterium]
MSPDTHSRYTISCDSRRHRVALRESRYWTRTKCPVCMQVVDTTRLRRVMKWLGGHAPRSVLHLGSRLRLVPIDAIALGWAALIVLLAITLHTVADAWWPATILLFLGRWPWLLPALPLFVLTLALRHRRSALVTLGATVVGLFGVMQLSLGSGRLSAPTYAESRVRVISFNIAGDAPAPLQLVELINEWEPDVLAVQECGVNSREQLGNIPGYHSDLGVTCLLTKFEIIAVDSLRREAFANASGAAWVKRYRLKGRVGEFDFTNVHLDTPRKAFDVLIEGDSNATGAIGDKTAVREVESRLARRWVDLGRGPRLVAGDFNMPVESAIFRQHWGSLQDGWEEAGLGFGYTRLAGWIRLRIDHILADEHWSVQTARMLPDYGSDHLPVMVEVDLKPKE